MFGSLMENTYLYRVKVKQKSTTMKTTSEEKIGVTVSQLVSILVSVSSSTFVNLFIETEPRMNKRGNPFFGRVKKITSGNYLIGCDYEQRVQNNEQREGIEPTFEASENKVGYHIGKCVLHNDNTGKDYLFYERFDETPPQVQFTCDGDVIEKQLFEDYLVKSSGYSNQGLDRTVKVQSVKIENIKEMTLNGVRYEVVK